MSDAPDCRPQGLELALPVLAMRTVTYCTEIKGTPITGIGIEVTSPRDLHPTE
jgi:hypothetical protein